MGTVSISGQDFSIYGEHRVDAGGVQSAINYFAAALHATSFTGASNLDQQRALVTATRMLDRQAWQGARAGSPQELAFPRTGLVDVDGQPVDSASVPVQIVQATYELANSLLGDAAVQTDRDTGTNIKRERQRDKVAELETETETERFRPTAGSAPRFPTIVQELVAPFLAGTLSASSLVFTSGTDVSTLFDGVQNDLGLQGEGLP